MHPNNVEKGDHRSATQEGERCWENWIVQVRQPDVMSGKGRGKMLLKDSCNSWRKTRTRQDLDQCRHYQWTNWALHGYLYKTSSKWVQYSLFCVLFITVQKILKTETNYRETWGTQWTQQRSKFAKPPELNSFYEILQLLRRSITSTCSRENL